MWKSLGKGSIYTKTLKDDISEPKNPEIESEPVIRHFIYEDEDEVTVTVYINTESYTKIIHTAAELIQINRAIATKDVAKIKQLMSITEQLADSGIVFDNISNKFQLKNIQLDVEAKDLILKVYKESHNSNNNSITGLINMVHRLNNVEKLDKLIQLYGFLKHQDIEILENGSFICYKYLSFKDGNYVDSYTQTIKQDEGDYVYTSEDNVNDNPNITCSYGLHVGSFGYVKDSNTISKVLVKPEDVVSVPYDYDSMKLRCKGYTILEILDGKPALDDFTKTESFELEPNKYVFVDSTR